MHESECLCISFNSPGTRHTSLPQPSVQDRITHVFELIKNVSIVKLDEIIVGVHTDPAL
jgi:hypothetical protein